MPIDYDSPLTPTESKQAAALNARHNNAGVNNPKPYVHPDYSNGRATGGVSKAYGMIPEDQQYRHHRPNFLQRMYDAANASIPVTQQAALSITGTPPAKYNQVTSAREARRDQYPPENLIEHGASQIGNLGRQALDPINLYLGARTVGAKAVAAGGALYGGAKNYMSNALAGKPYNPNDIAIGAATNVIGGLSGDSIEGQLVKHAIIRPSRGIIGEAVGRPIGGEVAQSLYDAPLPHIEDTAARAAKNVYNYFNPLPNVEANQ